jgi:predicted nucleotidyltransferase
MHWFRRKLFILPVRIFFMKLSGIKRKIAECKREAKERFGITSLSVFGSYARGEQTRKSDLDLLAEFDGVPSLIKIIRAEEYLAKRLGVKVDLVYGRGLKGGFQKEIFDSAVVV